MNAWFCAVIEPLAYFGLLVIVCGILVLIYGAYIFIREKIEFWHKRYVDRHRMEKPPMCKCYCTQCECWKTSKPERNIGLCTVWKVWTAQYETCSRGSLRTEEEYKNEKWRIKDCKN